MDRDIPAFNPIIINKIKQKNMEIHQLNLKRIKVSHLQALEFTKFTTVSIDEHVQPSQLKGSSASRREKDLD